MNLSSVIDPQSAFDMVAAFVAARAIQLDTGGQSITVQTSVLIDKSDGLPLIEIIAQAPWGNWGTRRKLPGPRNADLTQLHIFVMDFERWSAGPDAPCPTCAQPRAALTVGADKDGKPVQAAVDSGLPVLEVPLAAAVDPIPVTPGTQDVSG